MGITFKRGEPIASYEEATTVSELLELAKRKGGSLYREERDRWDRHGYNEYIIAAEVRLLSSFVSFSSRAMWSWPAKRKRPARRASSTTRRFSPQ